MSIECKTRSIYDLSENLGDYSFYIPTFQRAYVWGKTQIDEMFDDFMNDSNEYDPDLLVNENDQYLMGNVVIVNLKHDDKWNIVDGQQRLTTFTMIARQLEQRLKKLTDAAEATNWLEEIDAGKVLKNKPESLGSYHPRKLNQVEDYIPKLRSFYLLKNGKPRLTYEDAPELEEQYQGFMRGDKPKVSKKTKLKDAWARISLRLDEITREGYLHLFCKYFMRKVTLIMTMTDDWGKAYQTFEVLNVRGVELNAHDLIKGLLLSLLNSNNAIKGDVDAFNYYWNELTQLLQEKEIVNFLRYFYQATKGESYTKINLYSQISRNIRERTHSAEDAVKVVLDTVREYNTYATLFIELMDAQPNDAFKTDEDLKNLRVLNYLGVKQLFAILMATKDESPAKKSRILDMVVRCAIAYQGTGVHPNKIESGMKKLLREYVPNKADPDAFETLYQRLKAEHCDDKIETLKSNFMNNVLEDKHQKVFRAIEQYVFDINTNLDDCSIEHIMPQTPNKNVSLADEGFQTDSERESALNRAGNLLILEKSRNSAIGNKGYSDKLDTYKTSDIYLTKISNGGYAPEVAKIGKLVEEAKGFFAEDEAFKNHCWTLEAINKRSEQYANYFEHVLTKPRK